VAFNPLRNESDAFRVLVYFVAVVAVIIVVVVVVRAVS
jgi:t-SNARE complex subunit (syntaxin)